MAGLLDIFGTSGSDTLGLLGMSPADIQKNRDDAQAQALYALAGRLFQGGNTGASIAQGLQQGQQAYKGAMQNNLQDLLQNTQLQELIKKRKDEETAKQLFLRGYKPEQQAVAGKEVYGEDIMGQQVGEGVVGAKPYQPARFDIGSIAPEMMALGGAGQAQLKNALELQGLMGGKTHVLAEGGTLVRENPLTGKTEIVASGAPKKEDIAGSLKEARQWLGITTPVNEMTATERALVKAYVDRKDANLAPKVAVDIKDPTAVAQAQLKTINQWQGTLKDTGDTTVANRASAFYDALEKAKLGNATADGALIYNLAKIYDQTGAVQQGDVATIIGNRSIPTQIQLFAEKLQKGGTFTPKERENLTSIVEGIVSERQKSLVPQLKVYRKLNQDQGGSSEAIINPYEYIKKPRSLDSILGG